MEADQIFSGICGAYEAQHRPEVCDKNFDLSLAMGHYEDDFVIPDVYGHSHLIWAVLLVILFNIGLFVWCKNRKSRQD